MASVLVVDAWLPTPDRDSASLRMMNLLRLLKELSNQVTFGADVFSPSRPSAGQLEEAGIGVLRTAAADSLAPHLEREGHGYDLVILSRVHVAKKYVHMVRRLAPRASVVFDTTDLHFLRGFRGAKATGNMSLLKQAIQAKRDELAVAREADCTLVVSTVEKSVLGQEDPKLRVHIVSNIHEVYGSAQPFDRREGIIFVGAFPHHPNVDAMAYYWNEIYPLLKEKAGHIKTTVIGSDPPDWLQKLTKDDFVVAGYVPDIASCFGQCKMSVAPLRYGAGVKGKVLLSMGYGVPVVASTIAAEGIPVTDGRDMLIADDADRFSDKIVQLYHDEALWQRISENGARVTERHFSLQTARDRLVELFQMLGVEPNR